MKNPKWLRDELILTLNLYFNLSPSLFVRTNTSVIEHSKILNKLPIHSKDSRKDNFRNPNGVAMKLSNFSAIDPSNKGTGLKSHSKLDKEVFFEFHNKREELKNIANLILESLKDENIIVELSQIEDDIVKPISEAFEGEIFYKLHKVRERNKKLVEQKKQLVLEENGKLTCEVCDFDFYKEYGELGKSFIECHHNKHLSTYEINQKTTLDDLSLVCSNCHQMLHRKRDDMSIEGLKKCRNVIK